MSKVLVIKANPKKVEESKTLALGEVFLEEYKKNNPNDEIIVLDLYKEEIKPLDTGMIEAIFGGKENDAEKHAELFASCDKYIFEAPMWNLSIPAILKSYIDYVSYVGIAFKYTAQGAVGLLADQGKKAIHITARGGLYSEGPGAEVEMGDRYLRTILQFFGLKNEDIKTLPLELTNVLQGKELEEQIERANIKAKEIAKNF